MATKKKLLEAAAGAAGGGEVVNIEEIFSPYHYVGRGSGSSNAQDVNNGIDLAGDGGLVWIKSNYVGYPHFLYDTERGTNNFLNTDSTNAQASSSVIALTSFNSNGFTVTDDGSGTYGGSHNYFSSGDNALYISWP